MYEWMKADVSKKKFSSFSMHLDAMSV
jgi:hypothetical protein